VRIFRAFWKIFKRFSGNLADDFADDFAFLRRNRHRPSWNGWFCIGDFPGTVHCHRIKQEVYYGKMTFNK